MFACALVQKNWFWTTCDASDPSSAKNPLCWFSKPAMITSYKVCWPSTRYRVDQIGYYCGNESASVGDLGNKHSRCHRPEHQTLCNRLTEREMESKYMSENCEKKQVWKGFDFKPGWYCFHSQTGPGRWNWQGLYDGGLHSRTRAGWAPPPPPCFTENIECIINSQ